MPVHNCIVCENCKISMKNILADFAIFFVKAVHYSLQKVRSACILNKIYQYEWWCCAKTK